MSSPLSFLFAFILLGAITFFYRFAFINSYGQKISGKLPRQFLQFLAPATFTAIITNNILSYKNNPTSFRQIVIVAVISTLIAYLTRNIIITLICGLGLLYLLQNYIT